MVFENKLIHGFVDYKGGEKPQRFYVEIQLYEKADPEIYLIDKKGSRVERIILGSNLSKTFRDEISDIFETTRKKEQITVEHEKAVKALEESNISSERNKRP